MAEQTSIQVGSTQVATPPNANQSPPATGDSTSPAANTAAVRAAPMPMELLPEDIDEHIVPVRLPG